MGLTSLQRAMVLKAGHDRVRMTPAGMIAGLFRRWRERRARPAPAVSPGTRVYAVGDIHGQLGALTTIVEMIRDDAVSAAGSRQVLIFIGDYVDRGLDSRRVIDFLLTDPAPGFEIVFLKGNHDAWLLAFLRDAGIGPAWLDVGGQATLLSYGVPVPAGLRRAGHLEAVREDLARALPPGHKAFLEGLSLLHVEGDYVFVHAGLRPGVAMEAQRERDLLWIREEFTGDRSDHGKIVVHGHSVTERPDVRPNRIGIDTGAYATGRLLFRALAG